MRVPWTARRSNQSILKEISPGISLEGMMLKHKKDLHESDNHDGVITHLEPDFLESEVRWVLESITTKKLVQLMELAELLQKISQD